MVRTFSCCTPGEKGIVLLLLYLEAESEDNRPLIIDQPDDNLDNLSVYPSLIDLFPSAENDPPNNHHYAQSKLGHQH